MSQWQITAQEYFQRLNLRRDEFRDRLPLINLDHVANIVPLRSMKTVHGIFPINIDLLLYLIRHIQTLDKQLPFANAHIRIYNADPRSFKVGQKYVYRENYTKIVEEFPGIFKDQAIAASAIELGAYFVFGQDGDGNHCLACYLPPLIERHGSDVVLMDGMHRAYINKQFSRMSTTILIEDVSVPFPCKPHSWSHVEVISLAQKPPAIEDRYFNLQKHLFRDLKHLGIDG